MKKLFIPYELALKLKELGFDEECLGWFYKDNSDRGKVQIRPFSSEYGIKAPLWQQAFDFFLEKYNLSYEFLYDDAQIQIYLGEVTYPDTSFEFYKSLEVKYGDYNKIFKLAQETVLECFIDKILQDEV